VSRRAGRMLEFLGLLFGVCLRTGVRLPLRLVPAFWKALAGAPITPADLAAIDIVLYNQTYGAAAATGLGTATAAAPARAGAGAAAEEDADASSDAGDEAVPLTALGFDLQSAFGPGSAFACAAAHVRTGLSRLVPLQLLALLDWRAVERAVCGVDTVDVAMLRRHTQYAEGISPRSPHVQWFWEVLSELDQPALRQFIRFCWAQDSTPATDAEWAQAGARLLLKPSLKPVTALPRAGETDPAPLPRADTCFFNLELPQYLSKAQLRRKLLYAIASGSSMNADEVRPDDDGDVGGFFGGGARRRR